VPVTSVLKTTLWLSIFFCTQTFGQLTAAVFYGNKPPIASLCVYDKVIIDPSSDFNPQKYCNNISEAYAYVSLGEISLDSPYKKDIRPEWIIGTNKAWNNNHAMDQSSKEWQNFFLDKIIEPLWKKGYRNFFLDTLDSYLLAVNDSKLQLQQIDGIVYLIKELKRRHKDAKIILNRGFNLLPQVHNDINAVLIESLFNAWHQDIRKYEETPLAERNQLFAEINKIKAMKLPIIIVDYLPPSQKDKAKVLAEKIANEDLIPWVTDSLLQSIYLKKFDELPRKILIIFSNDSHLPTRFGPAVRFIGPILEYMGYVPKYINLEEKHKLPDGDMRQEYAGIIFLLTSVKDSNTNLFNWAAKQIANKIPVVFFNNFLVSYENENLKKLGLYTSSLARQGSDKSLEISKMVSQYVGHETNPTINPYDFFPLQARSSQVLLQMKNSHDKTEDAVAITPWGGYALFPYVFQFMPNYTARWVINPFEFLKEALRLKELPTPDTTTENGRRLMTVHVDGDGFAYQAKWVGGNYASIELRDKILKKFPIPTSVSVITGEIEPNGAHPLISAKLMDIARSIFLLPSVEIASHSFSHPMYWVADYKEFYLGGEPLSFKIPNYKFNITTEITGSVDFINKYLAPPNKRCGLFFWSGLADPSDSAIKLTYKDKLLNINGLSETYMDKNNPSLTNIRPMGIDIGGYYQVFAPIAIDFHYMNDLAGPLYGFEDVINTYKATDKPRRLKPIDIYYHFYSASLPAALNALSKVYSWALTQPVMNIFISDYIKKVLDYYQITIGKDKGSWVFYSNGDLRELRSNKQFGYPDLVNSYNIIGFKEENNYLYIHLGNNRFTRLNYQSTKTQEPYLVEANARVSSYNKDLKSFTIKFKGYMPLQFSFANVENCQISSKSQLTITKNLDNTITYNSKATRDEIHFNCR